MPGCMHSPIKMPSRSADSALFKLRHCTESGTELSRLYVFEDRLQSTVCGQMPGGISDEQLSHTDQDINVP